ncbi:butyrophilin subfamily 2 member A1-like isoform X2 [Sardina pilchardus]|uniref:butyrophilin subfamily 2 member A1-like isoform X2 n=1 Tax=Sardina pilchardus TaxID=27697 RepID=UPI002E13BA5E
MWWLLLVLPACHGAPLPDKFTLSVPDGPLSVWKGSSIILPCSLSPAFTESLQVRWHRPNEYKTPVLLYEKQQIQQQLADPQYKGRVSLIGELEKGNVSLKLENVTLADSGEFVCFVAWNTWYEQASVHLIVKVMGSPPVLSVTDGGSGQVNVTCVSDGWSPQPTLTWRNRGGSEISSQNHHSAPDAHGLVTATSWLVHSSSDSEWIACSVGLSEEERKESRVLPHIDTVELERILKDKEAEMESRKQESEGPWKEVFISFLVLVLLLLSCAATVFVLNRKGLIKSKDSKDGAAESHQYPLQASKEETESLLKKQSEEVKTLKRITELPNQLDESKREVDTLKEKIRAEEDIRKPLEGEVIGAENLQEEKQNLKQQNEAGEDIRKPLEGKVKGAENLQEENQSLKQQNEVELERMLRDKEAEMESLKQKSEAQVKELEERLTERLKQESAVELERMLRDKEAEMESLKQKSGAQVKELEERLKQESPAQVKELEERLTASGAVIEKLKQESAVELERILRDKEAEIESLKQKSEAQVKDLEERLTASGAVIERLKQESADAFPQNHALVLLTRDRLKEIKESPTLDETSTRGIVRITQQGKRVQCPKPNSNPPHYVICKDTFSSGQHYWEVRVEKKESWFVGVCSDSLRGQSGVDFTLQNGCWLLCYDKDQGLYVNTDPITPVQGTILLKTLGVFLDYSGHSLAFYDAESHECLYTFYDVRSAHPLVPVLSPGVRDVGALVIVK